LVRQVIRMTNDYMHLHLCIRPSTTSCIRRRHVGHIKFTFDTSLWSHDEGIDGIRVHPATLCRSLAFYLWVSWGNPIWSSKLRVICLVPIIGILHDLLAIHTKVNSLKEVVLTISILLEMEGHLLNVFHFSLVTSVECIWLPKGLPVEAAVEATKYMWWHV